MDSLPKVLNEGGGECGGVYPVEEVFSGKGDAK